MKVRKASPNLTPEGIEKRRQGLLRYYALHGRSPVWSKHISEAKKGKPSMEKGRPKPSSRYKRAARTRQRMSIGRKRMLLQHPEIMQSVSQKLSGQTKSEEAKENMRKARRLYFQENPEAGRQHGERMKEVWTRPEYIQAVITASNRRPNKEEMVLGAIIEEIYPGEFAYNGDYSLGVVLNRYIPDFVNVNGKKQVIEFFGAYWHQKEGRGEQETVDKYKQLGWDCLVIWDYELANVSVLKDKLKAFAGGLMS